jgi:hypothetical protein
MMVFRGKINQKIPKPPKKAAQGLFPTQNRNLTKRYDA